MSRPGRWSLRTTSPEGLVVGSLDEAPVRPHRSWGKVALVALALAGAGTVTAAVVSHLHADAPWSPAQPRIDVRRSADLPVADLGWVTMRDHFTVTIGAGAGHCAPLGDLLVVADTTLAPWAAFPQHRHAGVEVVNLVVDGTLAHEEAARKVEVGRGGVQVLAAGAGMDHTEANRTGKPVRFLQLWLAEPDADRPPAEEHVVTAGQGPIALGLLRRDVQLRNVALTAGESATWTIPKGRVAYVVCVGGAAEIDNTSLADGDGAALIDGRFAVASDAGARLVVIELPAPRT